MKKRNKRILKTIIAMAVFLLFMVAQGAIAVTACIDHYWALWVRGGIIWGLVVITLCFYRIKVGNTAVLGLKSCVPGEGPYFAHATLFLTLAIGMAEEIYFRGIICGMWLENGVSKAMPVSAGLFALCHALNFIGGTAPAITVLQIGFALVYGMVFALLYMNGKSLVPCILLHTFHDLCCYMSRGGTLSFDALPAIVQFVILIAYFVYLVCSPEFKKKECV